MREAHHCINSAAGRDQIRDGRGVWWEFVFSPEMTEAYGLGADLKISACSNVT